MNRKIVGTVFSIALAGMAGVLSAQAGPLPPRKVAIDSGLTQPASYRHHRHRAHHHHRRHRWHGHRHHYHYHHCGYYDHRCFRDHYWFYGYKQWHRWNPLKSRRDFARRHHNH